MQETVKLTRQTDQTIRNAYIAAYFGRSNYARFAIIGGQMLLEAQVVRETEMLRTKFRLDAENAEPDPVFMDWAEEVVGVQRCRRTLFYWMAAADRVIKHLADKSPGDPPVIALRDDSGLLISAILSLPADRTDALTPKAAHFRADFDKFMADQTSLNAIVAVVEGFDEAKRITLAANGKAEGGTRGEDRKDFPLYIARHFSDISSHFAHWDAMNATHSTATAPASVCFYAGSQG